jgi:hypothetical protein
MRKIAFITLSIILIAAAAIFILRFVFGGPEDDWICKDGKWIEHGNPSNPAPVESCER